MHRVAAMKMPVGFVVELKTGPPLVCSPSGGLRLDDNIFGKSFESLAIRLYYGNGNITGFPGFDISYNAGFAGMHAADDIALSAVS